MLLQLGGALNVLHILAEDLRDVSCGNYTRSSYRLVRSSVFDRSRIITRLV